MPYGNLKPEGYISRIVDSKLERLLGLFGAVEVAGTMWCGKTWTSLARAESVTRIGLSGPRSAAEADPSTALIGARPHLVDEWQDVPAIWDEVRAAVDADGASQGSFILTGSAEPNKDKVHHSGAGRIAKCFRQGFHEHFAMLILNTSTRSRPRLRRRGLRPVDRAAIA